MGIVPILLASYTGLSLEDLSPERNRLLPVGKQFDICSSILAGVSADDGGFAVHVHRVCHLRHRLAQQTTAQNEGDGIKRQPQSSQSYRDLFLQVAHHITRNVGPFHHFHMGDWRERTTRWALVGALWRLLEPPSGIRLIIFFICKMQT